ncbi:MAG TPA: TlpA disulfide reductase family protein [Solirubrobacter sp.]|nr:TlpA disulfide reductase family protein [Solirubrobacter sp.]
MLAALALAGCGGAAGDGGRSTLPGPLPAGVRFAPATSTAVAPPFSLALLDGTRVEGAKLWRDRPVVLFFFGSWCSRCAKQQQELSPLVSKYEDVVTFVGVAGKDKPPAVRAWLEDHGVTYPVGIDGSLESWRRYAVRQPPAVVLIGPGGTLERGWADGVDGDVLADSLARMVER